MSQRENIKRIGFLLKKISHGYPTKEELVQYLENMGFKCSTRTLERLIKDIRDEFWLEVKYDRARGGYYIEENEVNHATHITKLLSLVTSTDVLIDNFKESREALDYIEFDNSGRLQGIESLPELLKAVKNNAVIHFTHYSYYSGKSFEIELKPLLLKEYENRWYIVGYNEYVKNYRSYGIDRISNLRISDIIFDPGKFISPKDLFKDVVGLNYSDDVPQIVRIAFDKIQANYIKSLPLHHSQEIESETDEEVIMSYYVAPNFELEQKILMQLDGARVLEPERLVKAVRKRIEKMRGKYEGLLH